MVKKAIFLALFCVFAFGVNDTNSSQANKAYINSRHLNISFNSTNAVSPKIFVKAILQSLVNFGANIEDINELSLGDELVYSLSLDKTDGFNMQELKKQLERNSLFLKDIQINQNALKISLDASMAKISSIELKPGEENILDRSNTAYFVGVDKFETIKIRPRGTSMWFALIYGFDKNLSHLFTIKKDEMSNEIRLNLNGAKYLLISDKVDINNIKGGLILK
ncbi:MAG: hypothetical protein K5978_08215 [Campylobacter sp.]|nr:hypothetical protein [Campylobacter sp.]